MLHSIIAHLKSEAASYSIGVAVVSFFSFLGLLLNEVTGPKVLGVMAYLSDWKMIWTWEWWTRTVIYLASGVACWWWQKRKFRQQFDAMTTSYASTIAHLRSEIRHAELLIGQQRTELAVLRRERK